MSEEISFTPWRPRVFWSCEKDTPPGHLSRALGIPETYCIELSAHDWDDEERVFDELARAFSFPDYFGRNWDAASDCMSDVHDTTPRFLAVIRDIPASEAARANVARAASTIGAEYREERARCVVLDGWDRAEIEIRWSSTSEIFEVLRLDPA